MYDSCVQSVISRCWGIVCQKFSPYCRYRNGRRGLVIYTRIIGTGTTVQCRIEDGISRTERPTYQKRIQLLLQNDAMQTNTPTDATAFTLQSLSERLYAVCWGSRSNYVRVRVRVHTGTIDRVSFGLDCTRNIGVRAVVPDINNQYGTCIIFEWRCSYNRRVFSIYIISRSVLS